MCWMVVVDCDNCGRWIWRALHRTVQTGGRRQCAACPRCQVLQAMAGALGSVLHAPDHAHSKQFVIAGVAQGTTVAVGSLCPAP